jgi:CubicO group peptidase (beta-lactamase class C family)
MPSVVTGSEDFDYFAGNRQLIRNGVQAVLTCNGLFTSERTLQQVFKQELAYLGDTAVGEASGGNFRVNTARRWVSVGGGDDGPEVMAAFREGIGCVVMAPGMTTDDIDNLPRLALPPPDRDPVTLPWPDGDLVTSAPLPQGISVDALQAASDWAFNRETPEQDTVGLLVVHRGRLLHERYASGFDVSTRTRTWSTAKSIAATLIGMQVDAGKLSLDAPLGIDWLPELNAAEEDPRNTITLRHVLHMSSGLYPVDSFGMEYATGSGLAYWAGASSTRGMRDRGLVRTPGSFWDYENYDTLLAFYALKRSLGADQPYLAFPHRALFRRIGMYNTLASTDRFGDFIFSSQVYTNARDLARFGLLYLNDGRWHDQQLISERWIDFVRKPAPASSVHGNDYGGQWWLVPDERKDEVPADAYSAAGNRGQFVIIAPSHDLVIVRRGLDYGNQGFDPWGLLREVVKAFPRSAQ